MWSKQAVVDTGTRTNDTTSFRKITNKKSRNPNKDKTTVVADSDNNKQDKDDKNKQKKQQTAAATNQNQKAGRNRNKTKKNDNKSNNNKKQTEADEVDGVVLRNKSTLTKSDSVKRYSDSFVIDNPIEKEKNPTPLTRALSGFFIIDQSKKNRRLSDLFRPASSKLSGSTESLRLEKNAPAPEPTDSYLKRVKSKIYKSKSDDCSKIDLKKLKPKKSLDLNAGRIPEEDVTSASSPTAPAGIPKSLGHFHFGRLTRQTTNLERISRPFGSQKSVEATQSEKSSTAERPQLAKSKSSSAINLSLLRSRRAKMTESASLCKEEFEFYAFGDPGKQAAVATTGSTTSLNRFPSWLHLNKGEAKVSQPVSRSGSDRRPDAVREEGGRPIEDQTSPPEASGGPEVSSLDKEAAMPQESSAGSSSVGGVKRRAGGHINRSESVKEQSEKIRKQQRRNVSDPSHAHNVTYDEDRQGQDLSKNESGSSSNSSISAVNGRLSESPSNSMEVHQATVRTQSDLESDMEDETDPLNWQELVLPEELKKLNPSETKRQEVINELISTESNHVRMLKVLYKLFYKTLQESHTLKPDELTLIFPNIKELLDIHVDIENEMKRMREKDPLMRQIGDVLLKIFSGSQGELLQRAAATFCERQQLALEFIKKRRERDGKFDALLAQCEKKRQCKRQQLQSIVPYEMQRLTRYPLLFERLIKSVDAASGSEYKDELVKLRQVHQHSKEMLSYVDEATKLALNKHRLEEIQRHLDTSNFRSNDHPIVYDFKNIDLTRYKLILEGGLMLRRTNKAPVLVHVLLMEEIVVILQKESEKYILKFFQSGAPMPPLSPIIKMNTLLVRENASCKNALFLVNMSTTSSQMYNLQADDEAKRESWLKHFSEAADAYNRREGKKGRGGAGVATQSIETLSDSESDSVRVEPEEEEEEQPSVVSEEEPKATEPVEEEDKEMPEAANDAPDAVIVGDGEGEGDRGGGALTTTTNVICADEWPLIEPSQVSVEVPPVHTAEQMLTPLEQIRRKDALVKQALAEKEDLVADMLAIPREHFEHIADMASSNSLSQDARCSDITDRLLASVFQVDILQKAVNEAYNISEGEVIAARGGNKTVPACAAQELPPTTANKSVIPSVAASLVGDIAASLSLQLTTLLNEVKQVEDERDRLRRELHKVREQLHAQHHLHAAEEEEEEVVVQQEGGGGEEEGGAVGSDDSAQEVFCEAINPDEPN